MSEPTVAEIVEDMCFPGTCSPDEAGSGDVIKRIRYYLSHAFASNHVPSVAEVAAAWASTDAIPAAAEFAVGQQRARGNQ